MGKRLKVISLAMGIFLLFSIMLFSVAAISEDSDTHGLLTVNKSTKGISTRSVEVWGESDIDLIPLGNLMCDADWTIICKAGYPITSANVTISWSDGPIQTDRVINGCLMNAYGSVQRTFGSARTVSATLTGTCMVGYEFPGTLTPVSESTYVY